MSSSGQLFVWCTFNNCCPKNMTRKKKLTFIITAVTQPTHRRPNQPIHVESTTVLDLNIVFPVATSGTPMITNSTSNNAFSYWWVGTVQPARSMRTTASFWHTGCWHFVASFASEAIPGWQRMQVSLVTSQVLLICICHTTVKPVKNVIVAAWIWC